MILRADENRSLMLPLATVSLGGAAVAAAFLDFRLWLLGWIAFVPLIHTFGRQDCTAGAAFRLGIAAGLAVNVPAFYWLVGTIHRFGGFPLWLSLIFYVVLSLYSALQVAAFALAVRQIGFGPVAIGPAVSWVMLEFLYPNLFPWRLANSQLHQVSLLQIGELTGPFGLSFVMVWAASAITRSLREGLWASRASIVAAACAVLASVAFGLWRLEALDHEIDVAEKVRVGLVQGNLSLESKGNVQYFDSNLATYAQLSADLGAKVDVVIWPESVISQALPRSLVRLSPAGIRQLGISTPLLVGALTYDDAIDEPRLFNSVIGFDREGTVLGISDKQILMPFGEYLPFGSIIPALKKLSPQTGDFQAGARIVPLDVPGAGRFAPLNCYEDLRASLAREAVKGGAAEVLFAVANDAWFGDTQAPYQHEALAAWRAIETRRSLVRVTNTGVTDVIDPAGRIQARLPVFRAEATIAKVAKLKGTTGYVAYGDWFGWTTSALALGLIVVARRARSGPANHPGFRETSRGS